MRGHVHLGLWMRIGRRATLGGGTGGGGGQSPQTPLCDILVVVSLRGPEPFFPSHVASGRCFLSAAAAGAPAGVVSAFVEPSGWRTGAVLDVHDVPFARQRGPIIGVLGMCWLLPGSFDCFCCPHTSVHRPSIVCLAVFLCV